MSQEAPPVRKNARGSITEVFAEEARKLDGIEFLAQGTISVSYTHLRAHET